MIFGRVVLGRVHIFGINIHSTYVRTYHEFVRGLFLVYSDTSINTHVHTDCCTYVYILDEAPIKSAIRAIEASRTACKQGDEFDDILDLTAVCACVLFMISSTRYLVNIIFYLCKYVQQCFLIKSFNKTCEIDRILDFPRNSLFASYYSYTNRAHHELLPLSERRHNDQNNGKNPRF